MNPSVGGFFIAAHSVNETAIDMAEMSKAL